MKDGLRYFRLHWRSGKPQDISTHNPGSSMEAAAAAMNEAGIGHGALPALDYWEELKGIIPSADQLAKEGEPA